MDVTLQEEVELLKSLSVVASVLPQSMTQASLCECIEDLARDVTARVRERTQEIIAGREEAIQRELREEELAHEESVARGIAAAEQAEKTTDGAEERSERLRAGVS